MSKSNYKSRNKAAGKYYGKGHSRYKGGHQRGVKAPYTKEFTKENSSKDQRREKELADTGAAMSESNPISLYNKFNSYLKDAASVPFSLPVGEFFNTDIEAQGTVFPGIKQCAPGIMVLSFMPSIGVSKDFTSPINQTSIKFWTYLRSIQKAAANYDHQDITMMVVTLDSAIMFHSLMRRAYGLLGDFTPVNVYYPRALVQACGFDYDDLKQNISDFRMYINQFAYNIQQYALPDGVELFKRHQWMCEGLYTDSKSERAQTYIFVPNNFWKYDNTVTTGSQLTLAQWEPTQPKTLAQVMAFGDALINAFSNDEDFAYISGDMYAFFNGRTFTLPYTEENYKILPIYDETVLTQIENATIAGQIDLDTCVITQNPSVNGGAIIFKPEMLSNNDEFTTLNATLNFHWDSPTPDQVTEATRLVVTFERDPSTPDKVVVSTCGTEIVNGVNIYSRNPSTQAYRSLPINNMTKYINQSSTVNQLGTMIQEMTLLASFDWAPRVEFWNYVPNTTTPQDSVIVPFGMTWDLDNVQTLYPQYLSQINRASLMSLFVVGAV